MSSSAKTTQKPDADGLSFEAELAQRAYRSEKIAWIVACFASVIAALGVGSVMLLTPLKQVVPYYIFVDKETGATQAVMVNDPQSITTNEAVARHWLSRYVQARERYVYRLQQEDYNFVITTSAQDVGVTYKAEFEGPQSKPSVLGSASEERIVVLSVQLTPGVTGRGTVRYQKIVWKQGSREPKSTNTYVADVSFDFKPVAGFSSQDLLMNPMGFMVDAYRSTQEMPVQ